MRTDDLGHEAGVRLLLDGGRGGRLVRLPPRLVHLRTTQFKNNYFTEMCCGTEAGSYLRLIDSFITQLKAQGPSRTCNESKEEERRRSVTPTPGLS